MIRTAVATVALLIAGLTLTTAPANAIDGGADPCDAASRPAATWSRSVDPPSARVVAVQTTGEITWVCNRTTGLWSATDVYKVQMKLTSACHVFYREAVGFGAQWPRWQRYESDYC